MTTTERGRARQRSLIDFLAMYPAATTQQLAALIWGGSERLARGHLLVYHRAGMLRRLPHPLYRNGAYVYTRSDRTTTHSQKILHHLAAVDFHVAVTCQLGRYGVRVVPELPWAPGLVPDQTILWRGAVWAIEHHLSGQFVHAADYQRFIEEEAYELCNWWRKDSRIGLVVITMPAAVEHVAAQLKRRAPQGFTWRVATRANALRDPGGLLRETEGRGTT